MCSTNNEQIFMGKVKRKGNTIIQREDGTSMIYSKVNDKYFFSSEGVDWKNEPCCIDRSAIPEEILKDYPDF